MQYKSEERCNFYLKMHQKLFGGWALPRSMGELTICSLIGLPLTRCKE